MGFGEAMNICADVRDGRCEAATATHAMVRNGKNGIIADGTLDNSACVKNSKVENVRSINECKYGVQVDDIRQVGEDRVRNVFFRAS
jgi:hypothetical protein